MTNGSHGRMQLGAASDKSRLADTRFVEVLAKFKAENNSHCCGLHSLYYTDTPNAVQKAEGVLFCLPKLASDFPRLYGFDS